MSKNLQKTLTQKINIEGIGLHSGKLVNLKILPAEEDHGIKFKRTDISENNIIEAKFENVTDPVLCTKIKNLKGVTISTVEHLMAAFFGEGIDNVLVEINGPEVPIMDGSSNDFVEAIRKVGTKELKSPRKFINVLKKVEIKDGTKFISIEPLKNDLIVDFEIVYENPLIRTRRKTFQLSDGDLSEIYASRTFCLYEDIDFIKSQGLAQGGSLDNAIVVKGNEILNENGLRNRHEFVYHKILDCLGDLMLSGHRLFGHVKTSRGGHALTNKLLVKFFSDSSNWSIEKESLIDTNNKTSIDTKNPQSISV